MAKDRTNISLKEKEPVVGVWREKRRKEEDDIDDDDEKRERKEEVYCMSLCQMAIASCVLHTCTLALRIFSTQTRTPWSHLLFAPQLVVFDDVSDAGASLSILSLFLRLVLVLLLLLFGLLLLLLLPFSGSS